MHSWKIVGIYHLLLRAVLSDRGRHCHRFSRVNKYVVPPPASPHTLNNAANGTAIETGFIMRTSAATRMTTKVNTFRTDLQSKYLWHNYRIS